MAKKKRREFPMQPAFQAPNRNALKGRDNYKPGDDGIYFLPLGGSGEIGMNLNLYGTAGKWLMVDLGVTFADDSQPGLEIILPDPGFMIDRKDDLLGLVITHAHEDHIGAVEYLWPLLQCPIYCTPFTAAFLRRKLGESEWQNRVRIIEVPLNGSVNLGPFVIQWINMTHSVPEASALAIGTKHGSVLHTGDWKLDPTPLAGEPTNIAALQKLGDLGVMAMVCDSTNATVPGHSRSELSVRESFIKLFPTLKNRIVITCFSSNVARMLTIHAAAKACGRHVAIVGRSMWRIESAAREAGYLPNEVTFLDDEEAAELPPEKIIYLCTGSQGEPRSALSKLASGTHPILHLDAGDTVIYSSREIPGNEKPIGRVQNNLYELGVTIITDREHPVHVTGHPCQDELTQMYQWVRPQISVPVHGETRHQQAHAALAATCQVPSSIIPKNGDFIRFSKGVAEKLGEVEAGRWTLDGTRLRALDDSALKSRQKLLWNGAATLMLVLDEHNELLAGPQVSLIGFGERDDDAMEADKDAISDAAADAFDRLPRGQRADDVAIQHTVKVAVRKVLSDLFGKKPVTDVQITRI